VVVAVAADLMAVVAVADLMGAAIAYLTAETVEVVVAVVDMMCAFQSYESLELRLLFDLENRSSQRYLLDS